MTSGLHLLLHLSIETHCLSGVLATLSWLCSSPSHRSDRIRCDIVLATALTFLSCHLSQLLTPPGGFWSQWPLQCGTKSQSWLSSSASQRSFSLQPEHASTLTWWWPGHGPIHPDDCLQFFSFEPPSSYCLYLAYRMLLFFFCISFKQSVWTHHHCLSSRDSPQRLCLSQSQPCFPLMSLSLKMSHLQYSLSFLWLSLCQYQWKPWWD